ncbi:MAG: hypothetical protein HN736_00005 [Anaerolineae bacterium]|jgi:hypothetical protein|nr:hypothetical protein [Anaerolineae bacterium]MBT3713886.1 hypothetical protein [Anaerolineae bacterium]MBT4311647.1 hypothetical protein [Anaerolineae bacterium]MBT4459808.1 hypothetical protein [Anaerolineae bacterium]MBT4843139.1 hypothetical protein [Anaerolineae bacterium]
MLTKTDLICIPYTPDLTIRGIAYASRSLRHTYNRMGGSSIKRLQRIVSGIAVEFALRDYLHEHQIPFDVKGATPFTDPDRYDVSLGGHRCDVKSFMLSHKSQIKGINRDLDLLMGASALIPSDQFAASSQRESDIYIFAFLTGLMASSQKDMAKASEAGQPIHLIHTMPKDWSKPEHWHSLGKIALKSDCEETLTIELGGQDAERGFISKKITLKPRERLETEANFHTLAYAHVDKIPSARVGIHSPEKDETYLITSHDWSNIWVYGMSVVLAGYLTRAEFRKKAQELPVGSRVYQYSRTRTKNLSVPIAELRPLKSLFEQVQNWKKQ